MSFALIIVSNRDCYLEKKKTSSREKFWDEQKIINNIRITPHRKANLRSIL